MNKKKKALGFVSLGLTAVAAGALWFLQKNRNKLYVYRIEFSATSTNGKPVQKQAVTQFLADYAKSINCNLAGDGPVALTEDKITYFLVASEGIPLLELSEELKSKFNLCDCLCRLER